MQYRDVQRIGRIEDYCNKIMRSVARYGDSLESFTDDNDFQHSVSFSILQIGELAGGLSDDFKSEHNEIPWRDIKAMRNVVVHGYGSIDLSTVWHIVKNDVPELSSFCARIIQEWDETRHP